MLKIGKSYVHLFPIQCQNFQRHYRIITPNSVMDNICSRFCLKLPYNLILNQQNRLFNTSCVVYRARLKNQKRKIVDPVKLKKQKSQAIKFNEGVIPIYKGMTVEDLAEALGKTTDHIFEVLLLIPNTDKYDNDNSEIDDVSIIQNIVKKSGHRFKIVSQPSASAETISKDVFRQVHTNIEELHNRPPVVTIMGHVDHGKTTLLDKIRSSNIVAGEFGGITQHIGAFSVKISTDSMITFIDTPGHSAFSNMRARGASLTDIIILVVAADDGVMRTTKESIKLALDFNIPIIVAINKIDRPVTDVGLVKKELLSTGILLEELGGDVQCIEISALQGIHIDKLLEAISTLAEILDIKANPTGLVEGVVIESHTNKVKGPVATVLIQHGCVTKGSILVAGTSWCRVRNMLNEQNQNVSKVLPGNAIQLTGWKTLPNAGDEILQIRNEKQALEVVKFRNDKLKVDKINIDAEIISEKRGQHRLQYETLREQKLFAGSKFKNIYRNIREKEVVGQKSGPQYSLLVKTDMNGSLEAILDVLATYNSSQCRLEVVKYGVGAVNETDIELARTFNAAIYSFNIDIQPQISAMADINDVNLKYFNVIYKLIDDIKIELTERLEVLNKEDVIGEADVLQNFTVTHNKKKVPVAGCRCIRGSLKKDLNFKLIRNNDILDVGTLASLKHYKNEVDTINNDTECGLMFSDPSVIPEKGDLIQCYQIVPTPQKLNWILDF